MESGNYYLKDIDLNSYDVTEDLQHILFEAVDFCGCGMPDYALLYIRKGLLLLEQLKTSWRSEDKKGDYEKWDVDSKEFFGSDGSFYFFYYWCDKEDLSEHGGAVPGWLSEKGEEYLAALNIWHELYIKKEAKNVNNNDNTM